MPYSTPHHYGQDYYITLSFDDGNADITFSIDLPSGQFDGAEFDEAERDAWVQALVDILNDVENVTFVNASKQFIGSAAITSTEEQ